MSLRHHPRQQDRDSRMHDTPAPSHPPHPHNTIPISHQPPPSHQQQPPHPAHINGTAPLPIPPGPLTNGSTHPPAISPAAATSSAPNGVAPPPAASSIIQKLNVANEQTWLLIGRVAEQMGDLDKASLAYDHALRHNPQSLPGLTQIAGIARIRENYSKAIDYFQRVLKQQEENGEVWSALGHCYLMQDDLQKAYSAYQQALYLLPNPKEDPKLWYGIGILYDRYGSLDHAEEAFSSVLRMDKDLDFDRANEILFRLGIIYKQQGKFDESLQCFDRILRNPPSPLAHADIWFQIGHVYEQQKEHVRARDAYERVVADNPNHGKVLQQLGWLYHQDGSSFQNQDLAIQYLTKSLEAEPADAQSWYLLGRAYMAGQKYNKAYEAYQQAVYRDGRNPTFWCSIGVLYFQINQFRDALDAYSRAIRINPYISEVWFDLGSLYESCNNQITDAIDAYARASELDPNNPAITQRLQLLKNAQATGGQLPAAPGPQDVHPTAYASAAVPPGLTGPLLLLQSSSHRPVFNADSRGPSNEISLPPPSQVNPNRSSPPFRGGPPPPVVLDESRHAPSHNMLGPMEVDRPRDYHPSSRDNNRGPLGHQNLLLQHPPPPQPVEELRNGAHGHHQESYFTRQTRPQSRSASPATHSRTPRSPLPTFQSYPPPARQPIGPAQPSSAPPQRSPRTYPPSHEGSRLMDQDGVWSRRGPPPSDHRDWDRENERRSRHGPDYPPQPPPFFTPRSPNTTTHRDHTSPQQSPRTHNARYWESKPVAPGGPSAHPGHGRLSPPAPPPPHHEAGGRRYDPRYDGRETREYEEQRGYSASSPEGMKSGHRNVPHLISGPGRGSESPMSTPVMPEGKGRRRLTREKDDIPTPPQQQVSQPQPPTPMMQEPAPKRERKKRGGPIKRGKDDMPSSETPKLFGTERGPASNMPGSFKLIHGYASNTSKAASSPEPVSSNGSGSAGSSRSVQPSPTGATPRPPSRIVDENYDEGVASAALIGLAGYRGALQEGGQALSDHHPPSHSPTISSGSRHSHNGDPSPRPLTSSSSASAAAATAAAVSSSNRSHRNSVSSTRSHASPSMQPVPLKRALSPGSEESDNKRSRMDMMKRRASSPVGGTGGRRTPVPSTRPSPIPFRTQPASHSPPEVRQQPHDPPSPSFPAVLPPHPRPIGAGLSTGGSSSAGGGSSTGAAIALPPIATLSPASSAPSPSAMGDRDRDRDERMQVDTSRSVSPPSSGAGSARGKINDGPSRSSRSSNSPTGKQMSSPSGDKKD